MEKSIAVFVTYHRPSVCRHVCLPVWIIAVNTGRNFVTFIWDKFAKVYGKILHSGKWNEYAGRYIVRPEHICYVYDVSTIIFVLLFGDRLLILSS